MWSVFNNRVLTWEFKNINKARPGMCMLCKCREETTSHLFLSCSFAMQVWGEVETLLGIQSLWGGEGQLKDVFLSGSLEETLNYLG